MKTKIEIYAMIHKIDEVRRFARERGSINNDLLIVRETLLWVVNPDPYEMKKNNEV